jgi:hypothetical protein
MTETHDIILKTDRRWFRFPPVQRATLLAAFDSSGLSGPKDAQLQRPQLSDLRRLAPAPEAGRRDLFRLSPPRP